MAQRPRFRARPATAGLVITCTVVFVACVVGLLVRAQAPGRAALQSVWNFGDAELLREAGALAATRVWIDGQWWRVLSAGLLHGSWLHLGLNMLGLWVVGEWTEKAWGWWRQLILFVVASVGGCLASLAWAEAGLVVGASAGIFGLGGALVVARAWGREELREALAPVSARVLAFWLIFWLVVGALLPLVLGISVLAQAGHIGGLAFGSVLGWAWSRPKKRRLLSVLGTVGVVLGLGGAAFAASQAQWRPNYDVLVALDLIETQRFDEASVHMERALARDPDDAALANNFAYTLAEADLELERAEVLVRQALESAPADPNYLDTLGWIQCKRGQVDAGRVNLTMAGVLATAILGEEIPEIEEHLERCASVGSE